MFHGGKKNKLIIIIAAAIVTIAAAFGILWYEGAFLPGWINWERNSFSLGDADNPLTARLDDKTITVYDETGNVVWSLGGNRKVQSALSADIDGDDIDELLVLCWRIGRYGNRRPFWVKHDELKWSQHIYIYEANNGAVKEKWLASDIGQFVKSWDTKNNHLIVNTSPEDVISTWAWISWGLERVPDEGYDPYLKNPEPESESVLVSESQPAGGSEPASDTDPESLTESDNGDVEIIMVGDILLHTGVTSSCKTDDGYDFSSIFKYTHETISGADVAVVNQEVILGGEELGVTGYPSFNAPFEVGDALYDAGFDVVCQGTNHAMDRGKKGILNCLDFWETEYPEMGVIGIYDSAEDRDDVYIIEEKGIRIAFLNYTYGTNGIPLPSDMPYAVNLLNKEKITRDLEYAEANADFTVVCPHWGIEYQLKQCADQEKWAQLMVENGADLILGTHPHVVQPVEWVESENGNRGLCYYSLGNYINWTAGRGQSVANRMLGGMADVTIEKNEDGEAVIKDYTVYPLVAHLEKSRGAVTTYLLGDYTSELASKNAIREQDSSFSLEYCYELSEKVWGNLPVYATEIN